MPNVGSIHKGRTTLRRRPDLSRANSGNIKILRGSEGKPCPINEITPAAIHPLDSFLTFMCLLFKPISK